MQIYAAELTAFPISQSLRFIVSCESLDGAQAQGTDEQILKM